LRVAAIATEAVGNLSSLADDGALSARQEPDSPAINDAGKDENRKTGFKPNPTQCRIMDVRAERLRIAAVETALERLRPAPRRPGSKARPRAVAALAPFVRLGEQIVFRLSAALRRTRKKRAKERQRSRGGRALELRKETQRQAKKDAIAIRLAEQAERTADRQVPVRSARRSTPKPRPSKPS
jgi:hypothetical protein